LCGRIRRVLIQNDPLRYREAMHRMPLRWSDVLRIERHFAEARSAHCTAMRDGSESRRPGNRKRSWESWRDDPSSFLDDVDNGMHSPVKNPTIITSGRWMTTGLAPTSPTISVFAFCRKRVIIEIQRNARRRIVRPLCAPTCGRTEPPFDYVKRRTYHCASFGCRTVNSTRPC